MERLLDEQRAQEVERGVEAIEETANEVAFQPAIPLLLEAAQPARAGRRGKRS